MNEVNLCTLRPMSCNLSDLTRPDGSAQFCQGDTCCIVSVYGPGEVAVNKEMMDKTTIEVFSKSKSGNPGCEEKLKERVVRNTCMTALVVSLHPRSCLRVVIQEMHNSGSHLACCLNAVCLALLDSAISMNFMFAAVSSVIDSNCQIILDPNQKEEKEAVCSFVFVFDGRNRDVMTVFTRGQFTKEQFQSSLLSCKVACDHIFKYFRTSLEKKLSK